MKNHEDECTCFPGMCRGGEIRGGRLANGLKCKAIIPAQREEQREEKGWRPDTFEQFIMKQAEADYKEGVCRTDHDLFQACRMQVALSARPWLFEEVRKSYDEAFHRAAGAAHD